MEVIDYSELERQLDAKGAVQLGRMLRKKNRYDARARKAKLNPKELKAIDEVARRK